MGGHVCRGRKLVKVRSSFQSQVGVYMCSECNARWNISYALEPDVNKKLIPVSIMKDGVQKLTAEDRVGRMGKMRRTK